MPPSTSNARGQRSTGHDGPPRIALAPEGSPSWIATAITAGGGHIVPLGEAEGLVWAAPRDPNALERIVDEHENLQWIQLPFAGVEQFVHLVDDDRTWTCGKGVYAEPVGELALSLALAGMRGVGHYARQRSWGRPIGHNLLGAHVTILGGGGITESLIRLLTPFDCRVTVVRNRVQEMEGVDEVLEADRYIDALAGADLVVVALALTPDTDGMLSRDEFEIMEDHAWIVNVARGRHIVTDDLVWALQNDVIGGAALDVTDPEPLPDDHPLWTLPNCIITPHVGNTPEMAAPLLSERIATNVRRFGVGDELLGLIDVDLGY
jgi:phosphoglycerate dehydrogenase-like enzyme